MCFKSILPGGGAIVPVIETSKVLGRADQQRQPRKGSVSPQRMKGRGFGFPMRLFPLDLMIRVCWSGNTRHEPILNVCKTGVWKNQSINHEGAPRSYSPERLPDRMSMMVLSTDQIPYHSNPHFLSVHPLTCSYASLLVLTRVWISQKGLIVFDEN